MFHIYMISDASGETVKGMVKACLSQFAEVETEQYVHSLVRTDSQIKEIAEVIAEKAAQEKVIVLYSIVNVSLEQSLLDAVKRANVPTVPILNPTIDAFSRFFGIQPAHKPGVQHLMDEDYFKRIDAMQFALAHDDGQSAWNLAEADVILVGVSRTSKTPTCIYLANRGIKAANIPFVKDIRLPDFLYERHDSLKPMIFGLVNSSANLVAIRESRLTALGTATESYAMDYTDPIAVREEIKLARQFFKQHQIKTIDVTHRSIEEVSAYIMREMEVARHD